MTTQLDTMTSSDEALIKQTKDIALHPRWDLIYAIDWVAALVLFIATLPISIAAALWVAMVDSGNAFYTQDRVGYGLEPFKIYKIRTMKQGDHGALFCKANDSRIICGGAFLRKTRIDELPQLLNVLKGDMALVGPRPEQVPFVMDFLEGIQDYGHRFAVKPGITGLAQVLNGYADCEESTKKKLHFDLKFISDRGFSLWVKIVILTLRVVLTGRGAR